MSSDYQNEVQLDNNSKYYQFRQAIFFSNHNHNQAYLRSFVLAAVILRLARIQSVPS
jgi:hypothetical protein